MGPAPYADVAELKNRLRETTNERDGELAGFLIAATAAINEFTSRDFGPGTRTEYGSASGHPFIMPKASPIASVASFMIEGVAVTAKITLRRQAVERADLLLIEGEWQITYNTTEPVPHAVFLATLMTAQAMSDAPAFDSNLNGVAIGGVVQGTFQPRGAGYIPPGAQSLLAPHVRVFQV